MSEALALIWYIAVGAPNGGVVILPNGFDTREACEQAVTEFQKKQAPAGWSLVCVPDGAMFDDGDGSGADTPPTAQ